MDDKTTVSKNQSAQERSRRRLDAYAVRSEKRRDSTRRLWRLFILLCLWWVLCGGVLSSFGIPFVLLVWFISALFVWFHFLGSAKSCVALLLLIGMAVGINYYVYEFYGYPDEQDNRPQHYQFLDDKPVRRDFELRELSRALKALNQEYPKAYDAYMQKVYPEGILYHKSKQGRWCFGLPYEAAYFCGTGAGPRFFPAPINKYRYMESGEFLWNFEEGLRAERDADR